MIIIYDFFLALIPSSFRVCFDHLLRQMNGSMFECKIYLYVCHWSL